MANGISSSCDFCGRPAEYDGKTTLGPWAFMCGECWEKHGLKIPGTYTRLTETIKQTKRCSICGEEKTVDQFYTDHLGQERLRTECKACNLSRRRRHHG